jgi:hypothetical protein
MKHAICCVVLLAIMALLASAKEGTAKQDKKPAEWKPSVELTDKAGKWLLKEAKTGTKMVSDRDYVLSELPEEIAGGTYVMRTIDEHKAWLPVSALTAKTDATVYAIIRVEYLGKETLGEVALADLVKDGWKEVDGKVATTFNSGEKWKWSAYKKAIKKGDVILQLDNLNWDKNKPGIGVLYVIKP